MANIVGDIAISVGADIGPLVSGLARGQAAVSKFGNTAQVTASGGMKAMTLAGAAMAGAAVAAGLGLVALTRHSIENAGALHDASLKTGILVSSLQAMGQVAEEAGVSSETLTAAIARMQNNIGGLNTGTAAQVTAFGALGLSMDSLRGKTPDEQFAIIAASIEAIQDPAMRTASAMDIFGKSGADLIPIMTGYAAAVKEVADKQKEMGISLSQDQAAQLDAVGDSMGRVTMAAEGLGNQLAITFGPATAALIVELQHSIEGWAAIFKATHDLLTSTDEETRLAAIGDAAEQAADQVDMLSMGFATLDGGKISAKLFDASDALRTLDEAFKAGMIGVDEYKKRVAFTEDVVKDLIAKAGEFNDNADTDEAVAALQSYIDKLYEALGVVTAVANVKIGATASAGGGGLPLIPDGANGIPGVSGGATAPATITIPGVVTSGGGGGGGGGGGNSLEAELAAMRDAFKSETDLLDEQNQERLAKLEEFRQAKLITEAEYNDLERAAKEEHEQAIAAIEEQAMAVKLQAVSGAFGDLGSLMSSQNEKLFKIGKAASIASAIVDGYQAATDAWKKGMAVGGPGVAAAFTAASLAKTGAMIAGINRTQIGGSSSPSTGGGGAPAVGAPSAPLDVRLTGFGPNDLISGGMIGSLLDRLSAEAGDRGYRIMVAA